MQAHYRLLFIAIMSVILMSSCSDQENTILEISEPDSEILEPSNGVVQGKVTIGPLCPVEPCKLPPEQIAKIYQARKVIVYEQPAKIKAAEMNLNPNGEYSFSLKQGQYIIDITDALGNELPLDVSQRPRLGSAIPKEVRLKAGEKVVVDFDIDTGIR